MERWPPTYDAAGLAKQIRELAGSAQLEQRFYASDPDLVLCQGDIFSLPSPIPLIDEEGDAVAVGSADYWMAIGNTCDFARSLEEVRWTQLIPILEVGVETELTRDQRDKIRGYLPFRTFYVPSWKRETQGKIHIADFTRPVPVDKRAISAAATREARLTPAAWALFHSCLVRFLARDDGRHD